MRALISCGGNPVAALPDHEQTVKALRSLDLLVQVDPYLSQTARMADYVIAPTVSLEMAGSTQKLEGVAGVYATGYGFDGDEAFYTDPVVDRPAGSEVIEDWMLFHGLAARLGLQLHVTSAAGQPVPVDMERVPTSDELIDAMCRGSRISLDDVRRRPRGGSLPAMGPCRRGAQGPRLDRSARRRKRAAHGRAARLESTGFRYGPRPAPVPPNAARGQVVI